MVTGVVHVARASITCIPSMSSRPASNHTKELPHRTTLISSGSVTRDDTDMPSVERMSHGAPVPRKLVAARFALRIPRVSPSVLLDFWEVGERGECGEPRW